MYIVLYIIVPKTQRMVVLKIEEIAREKRFQNISHNSHGNVKFCERPDSSHCKK